MSSPQLIAGRIIWASIPDRNGIVKLRPAVILHVDEADAVRIRVVAVTSQLAKPLPPNHILLPWHPQRHPRTGLNRRCAAVCDWVCEIQSQYIEDFAGLVPGQLLKSILEKIAEERASEKPGEASDKGSML